MLTKVSRVTGEANLAPRTGVEEIPESQPNRKHVLLSIVLDIVLSAFQLKVIPKDVLLFSDFYLMPRQPFCPSRQDLLDIFRGPLDAPASHGAVSARGANTVGEQNIAGTSHVIVSETVQTASSDGEFHQTFK